MYERKFVLSPSDVDCFYEMKMSAFFLMMQNAATEHAELLGIGKKETIDKGLSWIITRIEVVMYKYPKYLDEVTMKTYPGDNLRFFFPRYYVLEDKDGNVLARASSCWAVIDKVTRKIQMNPFPGFNMPVEHHDGELGMPNKCLIDELVKTEDRMVRYSDTDLNGHLNNTKYVEYFVDTHDSEFYAHHRIKHVLINYEKEIKSGNVVTFYSSKKNPEVIVGKIGENNSFTVNIEYENR